MLVYRICSESEANYIINNGNFNNVGKLGFMYRCNSHNYDNSQYYMHFFCLKSSVIYHNFNKMKCICTYDIPNEILVTGIGIGEYYVPTRKSERIHLEEFAIRRDDMRIEFLKKVEKVSPQFDMNNISEFESFLETVYEVPNGVMRERKKEE